MSESNKCKNCQNKLGDAYYEIIIGDKIARQHNEAQSLVLCPACWQQKNEEYKEQFKKEEAVIIKTTHYESCLTDSLLEICKVCQKWSDEYEGVKHGSMIDYTFCSADCQKQYDSLSSQEKSELASNQIKSIFNF